MIVRAKMKPVAQLPERFICCEDQRRSLEACEQAGRTYLVDTSMAMIDVAVCNFCGTSHRVTSVIPLDVPNAWLALEMNDLDEGVAA